MIKLGELYVDTICKNDQTVSHVTCFMGIMHIIS